MMKRCAFATNISGGALALISFCNRAPEPFVALPFTHAAKVISSPRGRGRVRGKGATVGQKTWFCLGSIELVTIQRVVPHPFPLPPGEGLLNSAENFSHLAGTATTFEFPQPGVSTISREHLLWWRHQPRWVVTGSPKSKSNSSRKRPVRKLKRSGIITVGRVTPHWKMAALQRLILFQQSTKMSATHCKDRSNQENENSYETYH